MNLDSKEQKLKANTRIASCKSILERRIVATAQSGVVKISDTDEIINVGKQLTSGQLSDIVTLIEEHLSAFTLKKEIGLTNLAELRIELEEGAKQLADPLRRLSYEHILETRRQTAVMLRDGIIEESDSPWPSAYVLAKKETGDWRICIDFRKLNSLTKKLVDPPPEIDDCLDTLAGKKFFSQLDFTSGFWRIPMEEKFKELTAFRTEDGLFQFKRMPFDLTNAPASFQRMVNALLSGLKGMNLKVFIDDISVATNTGEEPLDIVRKIFVLAINANLQFKASKCLFGAEKVTFLGFEISADGIRKEPAKLRAITDLPAPKDAQGLRRVLGMLSSYREFVPKFAMIAEPLYNLTRKSVKFVWMKKHADAFNELITVLQKNANLAHFSYTDPIMLRTDASKQGVAGMLLQRRDGKWKIVSCMSQRLSKSGENYGITYPEGAALIHAVQKFRNYLLGKHFKILIDHCALCVLNKRAPTSSRLRRWAIIFSELYFKIIYIKGQDHKDIDCLSQAPVSAELDPYLEDKIYMVLPLNIDDWRSNYSDDQSQDFLRKAINGNNDFPMKEGIITRYDRTYVPSSKRLEMLSEFHPLNARHGGIADTIYNE